MIEEKSLSRKIAAIHQNVFLFEDTLQANITMFQEYPDEKKSKLAVKKAGLEKIVRRQSIGNRADGLRKWQIIFRWGKTADRD